MITFCSLKKALPLGYQDQSPSYVYTQFSHTDQPIYSFTFKHKISFTDRISGLLDLQTHSDFGTPLNLYALLDFSMILGSYAPLGLYTLTTFTCQTILIHINYQDYTIFCLHAHFADIRHYLRAQQHSAINAQCLK